MLEYERPPIRRGLCGALGSYVATGLYEGRDLFDILEDGFVQERRDDYPDLLGMLARDEVVVVALERTAYVAAAMPALRLAA
jgi:hypothetical protein